MKTTVTDHLIQYYNLWLRGIFFKLQLGLLTKIEVGVIIYMFDKPIDFSIYLLYSLKTWNKQEGQIATERAALWMVWNTIFRTNNRRGIIKEFGIKTATEEPIPANVLKLIIDDALPSLTKLINKSISQGSMDGVKLSVIDPLLKKSVGLIQI